MVFGLSQEERERARIKRNARLAAERAQSYGFKEGKKARIKHGYYRAARIGRKVGETYRKVGEEIERTPSAMQLRRQGGYIDTSNFLFGERAEHHDFLGTSNLFQMEKKPRRKHREAKTIFDLDF